MIKWKQLGDKGTKLDVHRATAGPGRYVEVYRQRRSGWVVAVHNGSHTGDLVCRGTRGRKRAFVIAEQEWKKLHDDKEYGMRGPVRKRSRSLKSAVDYVDPGGQGRARKKIPYGSVLKLENGRRMVVERSNGYVISGYEEGHVNRPLGIDLRREDAEIVQTGGKAMRLGEKAVKSGRLTMDQLKVSRGVQIYNEGKRVYDEAKSKIKDAEGKTISYREARGIEGQLESLWRTFTSKRNFVQEDVDDMRKFSDDLEYRIR